MRYCVLRFGDTANKPYSRPLNRIAIPCTPCTGAYSEDEGLCSEGEGGRGRPPQVAGQAPGLHHKGSPYRGVAGPPQEVRGAGAVMAEISEIPVILLVERLKHPALSWLLTHERDKQTGCLSEILSETSLACRTIETPGFELATHARERQPDMLPT